MTTHPARARRAGLATHGLLAALVYVPLLFTAPGRISADTKTYLYLDPGRLMSRAWSMWDPNVGLGTVTHQTIGYLWPIGPFYGALDAIGLPDWVAQRLWLGSILFAAGAGVLFLLRELGWRWAAAAIPALCYALTPYSLTLAARLSVILLPFAGLPWLIAFTMRAVRRGGWRDPALFALTVATIGGVNATALVFAGVGPLLWLLFAVLLGREATVRQALAVIARIGALTLPLSLWWLAGLWAQGRYGIEILQYTETAEVVAAASIAPEVLRGLGYWFFYGGDRLGPWIEPGRDYTQRLWLLVVTYAIPILALAAGAVTRWRERAFFIALVVAGVFISVGAYPWGNPPASGELWKRLLLSDAGLALRSTPRAVPLAALGLSVLLGAGVVAVGRAFRRVTQALTIAAGVLVVAALPPLFTGQMVPANLDRDEDLPTYWVEAARYLDDGDADTRVLELPGTDFASYRWGNTVDPITPGLVDRPYVARELIPYGSPASADLLNALDRRLQENVLDPSALAPIARLMGVGEIVARLDLQYERYRTPRPYVVWPLLGSTPGLAEPVTFGPPGVNTPVPDVPLLDEIALVSGNDPDATYPPVAAFGVERPLGVIRTVAAGQAIVVAGDGEGLVALAAAGLITGDELIRYAASLSAGADLAPDTPLVLTDSNRRRGRRWSTVKDNVGYTEAADEEPLVDDLSDNRLVVFPGASVDAFSVAVPTGGVRATASAYGNPVTFTPEFRAARAVDGDLSTAWAVGSFRDIRGERLVLDFDLPVTTDHVRLVQALPRPTNRRITDVDLVFDGGHAMRVTLDDSSATSDGQTITFPERTFDRLEIVLRGDTAGDPVRYGSFGFVGFAEVDVDGRHSTELVRVPTDLLSRPGADDLSHPLTISFERERTDPADAPRDDAEAVIARLVTLPAGRSFALAGAARLSARASDDLIDSLLGVTGPRATSSRRLPGDLDARASSAIDGDPATWWSPALGVAGEDWLQFDLPAAVTFDRLSMQALDDGRHSVPTRVRIEADGVAVATVDVAAGGDVTFPPVTGRSIRVVVEAVREVTAPDWQSQLPVRLPVAVVELGIPEVRAQPAASLFSTECRDDLVTIDGEGVPVVVSGSVADARARAPLSIETCDSTVARGVTLDAGEHEIATGDGRVLGIDIDGLVLQSAGGGEAAAAVGPVVSALVEPPGWRTNERRPAHVGGQVDEGRDGYWLVLGQSLNDGWHATIDGRDLGPPELVNGYANGWFVADAGGALADVDFDWRPQRVVTGALAASGLAAMICLGLAGWPRRRRAERVPTREPALLRLTGSPPSLAWSIGLAIAATVGGAAVIGPLAGVVCGALALLALRVARARLLVALGAPAALGGAALYIVARQAKARPTSAFEWPGEQSAVHQVGWMAVALLVIAVAVDWAWSRGQRQPQSQSQSPSPSPPDGAGRV